jgi:hypothetical protein
MTIEFLHPTAEAMARATAPFVPWLRFTTTPILPVEESSAIQGEAVGYRDSIGD